MFLMPHITISCYFVTSEIFLM